MMEEATMPIRSDHGRNAALRRLMTWPLHSPRRLALVVAAVVALGSAATIGLTALTERSDPPVGQIPPSSRTTATATSISSAPMPRMDVSIVGDPAGAAAAFAHAWVQKLDPERWRSAISRLCTKEFAAIVVTAIDPTAISAAGVAGPVELIRGNGRGADVRVPLGNKDLSLHLQDVTGRGDWRVSHMEQVS
jgi:hypothetical protein